MFYLTSHILSSAKLHRARGVGGGGWGVVNALLEKWEKIGLQSGSNPKPIV